GSATNDGGLGMLMALGMKAWDENGNQAEGFGKDLHRIHDISFKDVDPRVRNLKINVACDVDNPLCGSRGASVVFGPQKGASPNQVKRYDKALHDFSSLVEKEFNASFKHV